MKAILYVTGAGVLLLLAGVSRTRGEGPGSAAGDRFDTLVEIRFTADGAAASELGRVLVTAVDGGVLLERRDSRLLTITSEAVVEKRVQSAPFSFLDEDEQREALQAEFGPRFEVLSTRRYVIVTDAGRAYANYCGRMFERLQTAFLAYWKRDGLDLEPPEYRLTAVIFAKPEDYAAYAVAEGGAALAQTQGYYSVRTNRILLTDLTREPGGVAARTEGEVQRRLEGRIANLVTVVHEATHQIAFNCGLHTRYADNPMWLTEGMAMFFEAPDLRSRTGWRTAGRVHPGRLDQFREFVRLRREAGSLRELLASEDRFRDPASMADAYAESWALTWYLIHERRAEYVRYLQALSRKPRLKWDPPEQRLADFAAAFGGDLEQLEREFLQAMQRAAGSSR